MIKRFSQSALDWLWAALILLLPITSLPLLSRLVGGSMVAPAAALPMFIIAGTILPVYFLRGGRLPRQVLPLFAFVLVALISTALAFFIEFPLFREVNRLRNALSGIATLTIGVLFFFDRAGYAGKTTANRLAFSLDQHQWFSLPALGRQPNRGLVPARGIPPMDVGYSEDDLGQREFIHSPNHRLCLRAVMAGTPAGVVLPAILAGSLLQTAQRFWMANMAFQC